MTQREADKPTLADYEEALADYRHLVRELDVAMHGEERAATQASLCDLIEPARMMREENERMREAIEYVVFSLAQSKDETLQAVVSILTVAMSDDSYKHPAEKEKLPDYLETRGILAPYCNNPRAGTSKLGVC